MAGNDPRNAQFAEQFVALQDLWSKTWRPTILSSQDSRSKAEGAIRDLYAALGYGSPEITWIKLGLTSRWANDNYYHIDAPDHGAPICHLRNMFVFSAMSSLQNPERLARLVGYHNGLFRLPSNKNTIFHCVTMRRRNRRPAWFRNGDNLLCRFDADALAMLQLATEVGGLANQTLTDMTDAVRRLIKSSFGGFLFRRGCWLIDSPKTINLDEGFSLRAEHPVTAFAFRHGPQIWARNGVLLRCGDTPFSVDERRYVVHLDQTTPGRRMAMIEYFGWNDVLESMKRVGTRCQCLAEDKYGSVYVIRFNTHAFHVVQVVNSTAEPDGSFRSYTIPIDSQCRPLPDPNDQSAKFGKPQTFSGLNAVASTFGKTGKEYQMRLGAES